jgi:hypothetical protein
MAFEYVVDRESKFGTIVFDSINIDELPQPKQNEIKSRVDEVGLVNKYRLVDIRRTATIVFWLRVWLDENGYGDNWKILIPENSKHSVQHNKNLLRPNKLLSLNEALFLLLGLDTSCLVLLPFRNMELVSYKRMQRPVKTIEHILCSTPVYIELFSNNFNMSSEQILSEDLIEFAIREGFFNTDALHLLNPHDSDKYKSKESTKETQTIITKIAKEIIKSHQEIQKQILASDINKILKTEHDIKHLKDSTIERQYLKNFKKLKGVA